MGKYFRRLTMPYREGERESKRWEYYNRIIKVLSKL